MSFLRLIYASRLVEQPGRSTDSVLLDILGAAIRNNTRGKVTGLLLAHDGWFLQVLEGPSVGVNGIFERILPDPRHRRAVIVSRETVEDRMFGQWSMCARMLAPEDKDILDRLGLQGEFDPTRRTPSALLDLMVRIGRVHAKMLEARYARAKADAILVA